MVSDAMVAIVTDEALPDILPVVHRSGLGHTARVLKPKKLSVREQLRRAGVPTMDLPERIEGADAVLLIMAAARSPFAADLALQHGASATWIVTTAGAWNLIDDHLVEQPHAPQAPVEVPPIPAVPREQRDPVPAP